MLRFSDESTVLKYELTAAKEFKIQENFKLEFLRFWSLFSLLTSCDVVLHQKPV